MSSPERGPVFPMISMKRVVAVLLAAALLGTAPGFVAGAHAAEAAAPGVKPELGPWMKDGDFSAALARAKKEKKYVFIDFYATWCGPCKMMDRQVYTDSTVAKAAAKFVNRKVDAEKGEGIELAKRYGITAYPTMVIVDATGKEVNREQGFRPAVQFARFLDDTREGRGTIEGLEKMLAEGKDTYDNRIALGEKYVQRGDHEAAQAQFDKAIVLDPSDPGMRSSGLLLSIASAERTNGSHTAAIEDYERFIALYPASPRSLEARSGLAVSLAESGRPDEAFATYKKIADEQPENVQVLSSLARFAAALKLGLDEGLAAGKKAVELTQGGAQAYDALAEIHAARGEWNDAVVAAEKALAARPSDNYLRGRLEKFQEGAVLNKGK